MPSTEGEAPSSWRTRICGVCGQDKFQPLWELPRYPFTELFGPFDELTPTQNTELLHCEKCFHVQLSKVTEPDFLYNKENYVFSGDSPKHHREYEFLSTFIKKNLRIVESRLSLEFGANNLAFSKVLLGFSKGVVACDPLLSGASEEACLASHAITIDEFLSRDSTSVFDLVVARHTLEHLEDIRGLMSKLIKRITEDGLLVFEVPSFDCMMSKLRFDAITHQHLHYFTLGSFLSLAKELGLVVQDAIINDGGSNGGSLLVALCKSREGSNESPKRIHLTYHPKTPKTIRARIKLFERFMGLISTELENSVNQKKILTSEGVVGFGASVLLPTLNYHLRGAIEGLDYVLDDDVKKNDLSYRNLRVQVKAPATNQLLENRVALVTSYENSRAVIERLCRVASTKIICPYII